MDANRLSTAQIFDRVQHATGAEVPLETLRDILWTLTSDHELMAELGWRYAEWRQDMEETRTSEKTGQESVG